MKPETDYWNMRQLEMQKNIISDELINYRLGVCTKCEFIRDMKFCGVCNCFIPVKVKFKNVKCPINKWDVIDGNSTTNNSNNI